ncbi:MAG: hypothetical protein MZV64_53625 [Ignavibacteriales bacterium]|nr:hypothetical protein [Ignavibacteriales bacterium]
MPVIDKRNNLEDTLNAKESLEKIEELISKNILEKNYDVLSVSTVKNLLKGKEIQNLTPGTYVQRLPLTAYSSVNCTNMQMSFI